MSHKFQDDIFNDSQPNLDFLYQLDDTREKPNNQAIQAVTPSWCIPNGCVWSPFWKLPYRTGHKKFTNNQKNVIVNSQNCARYDIIFPEKFQRNT